MGPIPRLTHVMRGYRHGFRVVSYPLAGTIAGAVATVIYAVTQHWSLQIPAVAFYLVLGAALVIGAIAGLCPSMRAAHLSPTEALRRV